MTESEDRDRYIVPALERGLRLLRGFTHGAPAMSLGEIAKANELPRATAFRLIRTLEVLGYLRRIDGTKTYRLGPAVLSLGFEYLASVDLPEIAGPALEGLRDRTGASAHLAVRDRDEIVYLCRIASRSTLTSSIRIGSRLAAHGSSMGRALLADLSMDEDILLLEKLVLLGERDRAVAWLERLKERHANRSLLLVLRSPITQEYFDREFRDAVRAVLGNMKAGNLLASRVAVQLTEREAVDGQRLAAV